MGLSENGVPEKNQLVYHNVSYYINNTPFPDTPIRMLNKEKLNPLVIEPRKIPPIPSHYTSCLIGFLDFG